MEFRLQLGQFRLWTNLPKITEAKIVEDFWIFFPRDSRENWMRNIFLLNLKDWNEKFQRLFCNTKIQWQNWTFFSIEDSKYFEFESNSSYRVEFIKNFRHNNCFHRKIFSITAMQKNFDFEKIFSIITIEDSKDFKPDPILLHLVKYFKNFKDNNYPRTKIFFHHFHQRFNKWRFLSFDSPIYFITLISSRKKNNSFARRNLFIIQLIPPSCRFSLTFRGTRIIYVCSGRGPFFPFIERTLIKFLQFSRRTKGQFTRFSCSWPNGCN